mmetsp:Transcript_76135/g.223207  ORF Transcript_76135/g.223207 Transcript_76135/m.223207 type:complete len:240 (-) Transcript_76135:627-1346(-)
MARLVTVTTRPATSTVYRLLCSLRRISSMLLVSSSLRSVARLWHMSWISRRLRKTPCLKQSRSSTQLLSNDSSPTSEMRRAQAIVAVCEAILRRLRSNVMCSCVLKGWDQYVSSAAAYGSNARNASKSSMSAALCASWQAPELSPASVAETYLRARCKVRNRSCRAWRVARDASIMSTANRIPIPITVWRIVFISEGRTLVIVLDPSGLNSPFDGIMLPAANAAVKQQTYPKSLSALRY